MHSAIRGLVLICGLTIPGEHTLFAQTDAPQTGEPGATYRISTNLVLVNTVALKAGTAIPDGTLTREDFELFDNGRPGINQDFR